MRLFSTCQRAHNPEMVLCFNFNTPITLTGVGRGFHLVKDEKDPETGEVFDFTHEDYIEAAQRCLVIEKEL